MSWRRFTTGSFGGLSARQYTEVQDAVRSLVGDLGGRSVPGLDMPRPMLVRIKERLGGSTAGPGSVAGSDRVDGAYYTFEQVFVRVTASGIELARRPEYGLESRIPESGSAHRSIAIELGTDSNLAQGDIVTVYPAAIDMGEDRTQVPERQSVFIIISRPIGVQNMYVTSVLEQTGKYLAKYSLTGGNDPSPPLTVTNIYETSQHYGASLPANDTNECATITPNRLALGDQIFVYTIDGELFTMAPVSFSSSCDPCDPVQMISRASDPRMAIESSASSIVMR